MKSSRIVSYVHGVGTVGVLVELCSESDFVSKHEDFQRLAYDIAMQIAATNPLYVKKDDVSAEENSAWDSAASGEQWGLKQQMDLP